MTTERFTVPIDENGNVEFTKEFLTQTGWKPGVKLEWIDNGDGTVTIFELESDTTDGDPGE